jgi:transcriptional regulator with XRE-family HTH domain
MTRDRNRLSDIVIVAQIQKARVIASVRKAQGLSQARLAARARVHPSTLSLAESGKLILSERQLRRIARALGMTIHGLTADAERAERGA